MISTEKCSVESRNKNQDLSQNQQDQLKLLPDEIKRYLCTFLDANSFFAMKQTSKEWKDIILDDRTSIEDGKTLKKIYTDKLNNDVSWKLDPFRNLLNHGALGELRAAEKIWRLSPDLLTRRGTIYHPNRIYDEGKTPVDIPFYQNPGRYKYNHTVYQIFIMNSEFEE